MAIKGRLLVVKDAVLVKDCFCCSDIEGEVTSIVLVQI